MAFNGKHTIETKEKISKSKRGKPSWNKGLIGFLAGIPKPWKSLEDDKSPSWKGEKVGYRGLHLWVEKHLGRPKVCENCGEEKPRMHWANISGQYKRILTDWLRLCPKCHKHYDMGLITISSH